MFLISTAKALFIISPADVQPTASRNLCKQLGLIKRVCLIKDRELELTGNCEIKPEGTVLDDYPDLFEGLGCLPHTVSIKTRYAVKSVVDACRKVPFCLQVQLKAELERMKNLKVIEKVEQPTD